MHSSSDECNKATFNSFSSIFIVSDTMTVASELLFVYVAALGSDAPRIAITIVRSGREIGTNDSIY